MPATALLLTVMILATTAHAATYYWVGGNGDSPSVNANDWEQDSGDVSANCGAASGDGSVPGSADDVIFDADCDNNATMTADWEIGSLTIEGGYTGTLDTAGFDLSTNGNWTLDGTIDLGSGTHQLTGSVDLTNGTVIQDTSTVILNGPGSETITSASESFHHLVISDGLVGYWTLDETDADGGTCSGGEDLCDASGYGRHGTQSNGVTSNTDTASVNFNNPRAIAFDGVNDFVELDETAITGTNPLDLSDSFSVAFWLQPTAQGSFYLIGNYNGSGAYTGRHINFDGDPVGSGVDIQMHIDDNTDTAAANAGELALDEWHHIVGVRDKGNEVYIYLNGRLVSSDTDDVTDVLTNRNWVFGAKADTPTEELYTGLLDDVRIYDRALSAAEIYRLASGDQPQIGRGTYTIQDTLDVEGKMIIGAGVFDGNSLSTTVAGSFYNYGGRFDNNPDFSFNTSDSSARNDILSGGATFGGVTILGANGIWRLVDNISVNSNLSTNSGKLTYATTIQNLIIKADFVHSGATAPQFYGKDGSVTFDGDIQLIQGDFTAPSGTMRVSGDFEHISGLGATFDANNGHVIFSSSDAATITPIAATDFNDVSFGDGLIGYWKLDSTAASGVTDHSGFGNDGTVNGNPLTSAPGPTNFPNAGSINFDGAGDYVTITESDVLDLPRAVTVTAWIKTSTTSKDISIFVKDGGSNQPSYSLDLKSGGTLRFFGYQGASAKGLTGGGGQNLGDNVWYHVAGSFDGTTWKTYIDGVVDKSTVSVAILDQDDDGALIGARNAGVANLFDGNIDDVRIYNRALSATEINYLALGKVIGSSAGTYTMAGDMDINGTLDVYSGALDLATNNDNVNVAGNITIHADPSSSPGTGTVTFDGDLTYEATGNTNWNFGAVTINGGDTTLASTFTAQSLTVNDTYHFITDGYEVDLQSFITVHGTFNAYSGTDGNSAVTIGSTWTMGSSGRFKAAGSTVTFEGTMDTIDITSLAQTFDNITFNDLDGGTTWTLQSTLGAVGNLTHSAGTLNDNGQLMTVDGNWSMSATFTSTGTVIMTTSSSATVTSNGEAFNDLAINDGLVGYWKLDETGADQCSDGSRDACDSSGYGRDLSWVNNAGADTDTATTHFSNARAVSLDGTGDYLDGNDILDFDRTDAFSGSFWVKRDTTGSNEVTLGKMLVGGTFRGWLTWFHSSDEFQFLLRSDWNGGVTPDMLGVATQDTFTDTTAWHHYAFTYDGSSTAAGVKLYVDGIEQTTDTDYDALSATTITSASFNIGARDDGNNEFDGLIDDVRVYNHVLSAAEVQRLANGKMPQVGRGTVTLSDVLDVDGDLMLGAGTLAAGGSSITVAGSWLNYGGIFDHDNITVTFDGTSGNHQIVGGQEDFYIIQINGAGGTWNLGQDIIISDDLGIDAGTLDTSTWDMAISEMLDLNGGTLDLSTGVHAVASSVDLTGGTVTKDASTLVFNPNGSKTLTSSDEAMNDVLLTTSDGLVGWWKFDEAAFNTCSGGEDACDSSGQGNHATETSTPTITQFTAPLNFANARAMEFDGAGDSFTTAYDSSHEISVTSTGITISAWIYMHDVSGGATFSTTNPRYIVIQDDDGNVGDLTYGLRVLGQNLNFLYRNSADTAFVDERGTGDAIDDEQWHHVAAVHNTTAITLYVDGQAIASTTTNDPTDSNMLNNEGLIFGRQATGGNTRYFDGVMDDVRIYNRPMSASEIRALYRGHELANDGNVTLSDVLDVDGDIYLASGTLDVSGSNYQINVAGTWFNTGAVFTERAGKVVMDGSAQGVKGDETFWMLSKTSTVNDTMYFGASDTVTVSSTLTLTGTSAKPLKLRSTSDGNTWQIVSSTTSSFSNLDIQDSDNETGSDLTCLTSNGCVDSGNNYNWVFTTTLFTWTGLSDAMTWDDAGNWTGASGYPGTADHTATIDATAHDIVTIANSSLKIGALNVSSGFSGSLTLQGTFTLSTTTGSLGDFTFNAGTYTDAGYNTIVGGSITLGATFTSTGTVIMTTSTAETVTSGGQSFNDLAISDGLIGYWKLDSTAVSGVLDHSGYENHGAVVGAPLYSSGVNINFENLGSLYFDGNDDYVNISSNLNIVEYPYTITAWVKTTQDTSTPSTAIVAGLFDSSTFSTFRSIGLRNNVAALNVTNSSRIEGTRIINDGQWHHIVGTFVSSTSRALYVDGVQENSASALEAFLSLDTMSIGRAGDSTPSSYLDGHVDDVRVYDRELSVAEIQRLANGFQPQIDRGRVALADALDVDGDLLLGAGTLVAGGNAITVGGSWLNYGGLYESGGNTVTFDSAASGTHDIFSGSNTFATVVFDDGATGGAWSFADNFEATTTTFTDGDFTHSDFINVTKFTGDFTFNNGNVTFDGTDSTFVIDGDFTMSNGTFTAPKEQLRVTGAFNQSGGTFTHNSGQVMLSSTSNQQLASSNAFNDLIIGDGLIGYWKLDSTASIPDLSGYGYNGTIVGTPTISADHGPIGFANSASLNFTAGSDRIDIDSSTVHLMGTESRTFSFWIKPNDITGTQRFLTTGCELSTIGGYEMAQVNGRLRVAVSDGAEFVLYQSIAPTDLENDKWFHVALVLDRDDQYIYYVDGQVSASDDISDWAGVYIPNNHDLFINHTSQGFDGKIDDVRIYNRALSADEIRVLAQAEVLGQSYLEKKQTVASALDVDGDLILSQGTLIAGASGITVANSWLNMGGDFDAMGIAVTFDGASHGSRIVSDDDWFYDVDIDGTGTWTIADNMLVGNDLDINGGTLNGGDDAIIVGNDWTNAGGSFTAAMGTVIMTATQDGVGVVTGDSDAFNDFVVSDGLVGYWKLDSTDPSGVLDHSGYGYHGTVGGNPTTSTDNKVSLNFENKGSINFDGAGDYIGVGDISLIETAAVTFAGWFKTNDNASDHDFFTKGSHNTSQPLIIWRDETAGGGSDAGNTDALSVLVFDGTTQDWYSTSTGSFNDTDWHHIAVTIDPIDSNELNIYIDGQLDRTGTLNSGGVRDTSTDLRIGSATPASVDLDGFADDIRIYNRALSATEVARLANGFQPQIDRGQVALADALDVDGDLLLGAGTLVAGGNAITVGGSWLNYGGLYESGGNTVTFDSAASGTHDIFSGSNTFATVVFDDASTGGAWSFADNFEATTTTFTDGDFTHSDFINVTKFTGDFTFNNANVTFDGTDSTFVIDGDFTMSNGTFTAPEEQLHVTGAWSHTGGTFAHNSGQVMFISTQDHTINASSTTFNDFIIGDGLVAYYKLDSTAAATDYSGYGNHGTVMGSPQITTGVLPYGFTNNGSWLLGGSEYVFLDGTADLYFIRENAFTISAWVYPDGSATGEVVVSRGATFAATSIEAYYLAISDADATVWSASISDGTNNIDVDSAAGAVEDGKWQHMVVTWDGTTLTLYKDGAVLGSGTNADFTGMWFGATSNGNRMSIGEDGYFNNDRFVGRIDEVRFYNRALSSTEISTLTKVEVIEEVEGVQTLSSALDVDGDMLLFDGTLNTGGNNINVANSWINTGAGFEPLGAAVTFDGTSSGSIINSNEVSFYDVQFEGAGMWTLSDHMRVSNDIDLNAGTLDGANKAIVVANNWTNAGGAFTASTGSVVMTGTQDGIGVVTRDTDAFNDFAVSDGLVGYWKLDDTSPEALRDFSGYGHHGRIISDPLTSPGVALNFNNEGSIYFDGSPVVFTDRDAGNQGDIFTASVWLKQTTQAGNSSPFGNASGGDKGWAFYQNGAGTMNFIVYDYADSSVKSGVTPDLGEWYHLAGVSSATELCIYINGVQMDCDTKGAGSYAPTKVNPLRIGIGYGSGDTYYGSGRWYGYVDEARIYNRALSAAEIQLLANGFTPGTAENTVQLADALDVDGDMIIGSGTFTPQGNNITVAGSWLNYGGDFDSGGASVTMDGADASFDIQSGSATFGTFVIDDSGTTGQWVLTDNFGANTFTFTDGALTLTDGVDVIKFTGDFSLGNADVSFDGTDTTFVIDGDFTQSNGVFDAPSEQLRVTGDYSQTGGTWSHNNGQVMLTSTSDTSITSSTSFNDLLIGDGLVGYWSMDSTASIPDLSGYGNNGTITGSPVVSGGKLPIGFTNTGSFWFDEDDGADHIDLGYIDYSQWDEITITAWLKMVDEDTAHNIAIGNANQNTTNGFSLSYYEPGIGQMICYHAGTLVNKASFDGDDWFHVGCVIKQGRQMNLYVDGILTSTQTSISTEYTIETGNNTFIGRGATSHNFNGNIDDVRIYNRALSADEIRILAQAEHLDTMKNNQTQTLAATIDVDGDLILSEGTMDVSGSNYQINLGGTWYNTGAVFSERSGRVVFDGTAQGVFGGETFWMFSKTSTVNDTLYFSASDTVTISSTLTLTGPSSAKPLKLRSTSDGNTWQIVSSTTSSFSNLDIQDSDNETGSDLTCLTSNGCVDSGNNYNWVFTAALFTWTGLSDAMTWNDAGNWTGASGYPGTADHTATIDATAHDIVTIANSTLEIGELNVSSGFSGSLTLQGTFTLSTTTGSSGDFTFNAGTYTDAGYNTIVGGSITLGATFTSTGTVIMTTSTEETLTSDGQSFKDLAISDGLVGYWKLDSTAPSGVLDHSGYGNHGVVGGTPSSRINDVANLNFANAGAIEFVNNDYVQIESLFGEPQQVSLCVWGDYDGTGQSHAITLGGNVTLTFDRKTTTNGVTGTYDYGITHKHTQAAGIFLDDTGWRHVCYVLDTVNNEQFVYIDGVVKASTTYGNAIAYENEIYTRIGNGTLLSWDFHGGLDDVRVYNRALSAAEVARLANGFQPQIDRGRVALADALDVDGDLMLTAGTLAAGGSSITVGGSWLNYGGLYESGGNTVTFDSAGSGTHDVFSGSNTFATVVFDDASTGGAWSFADNFEATTTTFTDGDFTHSDFINVTKFTGDFTFSNANVTFDGTDSTFVIDGDFTMSNGTFSAPKEQLRVTGAWSVTGGTFSANNGSVMVSSSTDQTFNPTASTFNDLIVGDGLVGYWSLDSTASIPDLSGYGNDGAINGSPLESAGKIPIGFTNDGSIDFDGASDYVQISESGDTELDLIEELSVSLWFYSTESSWKNSWQGFMAKRSGSPTNYGVNINGASSLQLYFYDAGYKTTTVPVGTITTREWHHFVGTLKDYGDVVAQIYIDGELQKTTVHADADLYANDSDVIIGATSPAVEYFEGKIDDVRIYNRVLSSDEIRVLAQAEHLTNMQNNQTQTLNATLDVDGDLILSEGTMDVSGSNYQINVAGTWFNTGAVFTERAGKVVFDGTAQGVQGDETFWMLSKTSMVNDTMYFGASDTVTISSTLTLTGPSSAKPLKLRSTSSGNTWQIVSSETTSFSNLDVKDSDNETGSDLTCLMSNGCVDSGNNFNWLFSLTAYVWTGLSDAMTWEDVDNWGNASGYPNRPDETATIDATSDAIVISGTIRVGSIATASGFTGKITLAATVTISNTMGQSGDLTHLAGTYVDAGFPTIVQGSITLGATFTSTGTVIMTTSTAETLTSGGQSFNDLAINDGLVGYWKLDETGENSGRCGSSGNNTDACDSSGYANHGEWGSGPIFSRGITAGQNFHNPGSLWFDGANDHILIEDQQAINFSNQSFSWSFWVKREELGTTQAVFSQGTSSQYNSLVVGFRSSDKFTFAFWSEDLDTTGTYAETDSWHHWAGTYDASTNNRRIYRDGELKVSDVASADYQGSGDLGIGGGAGGWGGNYFGGHLDDIRIYKGKVLSAAEIHRLANGFQPQIDRGQVALADALDVDGDLMLAAGTLAAGGSSITVGGSWLNYGGIFDHDNITVTFDGTSGNHQIVGGQEDFYIIQINGAGGTWNLGQDIIISDDLGIDAGTLDTSTWDMAISGMLDLNGGTLDLSTGVHALEGSIDLTGGTVTKDSSTLVFNPNGSKTLTSSDEAMNDVLLTTSDGLVGWWKFDETGSGTCSGGEDSCDSSGSGYHGTWSDDETPTLSTAPLNFSNARALDLNGAGGDTVVTADISEIELSAATFALWVQHDKVNNDVDYFAKSMHAGNQPVLIWRDESVSTGPDSGNIDAISVVINDGTTQDWYATSSGSMNDTDWHHVAVTLDPDNDELKIYIDGIVDREATMNSNGVENTAATLHILGNSTGSKELDGRIDDVRIYNRALTSKEIQTLYRGHELANDGNVMLSDSLDVDGDIYLASGTLDVSGSNYQINVAGTWFNTGAVFTERAGKVVFDGTAQGVQGDETFWMLSKTSTVNDTMYFGASDTVTISSTLTLKGSANKLLNLRSTSSGNVYFINSPQTFREGFDINFLNIQDAHATGGETIKHKLNVESSGNTAGWAVDYLNKFLMAPF